MSNASNSVIIRLGNILESNETYLINPCNCTSIQPSKGLCKDVFEKWPHANCYTRRMDYTQEPDKPGTIRCSDEGRGVINMMAQLTWGAAGRDPDDMSSARFGWFQKCLEAILKLAKYRDSYAFPYRIPEMWSDEYWLKYETEIRRFNTLLPANCLVVMYKVAKEVKPITKPSKRQRTLSFSVMTLPPLEPELTTQTECISKESNTKKADESISHNGLSQNSASMSSMSSRE